MIQRKLTLVMENKPGALARFVGLFHQRGYNIDSLHVDPIEDFEPFRFIEDELGIKFQVGEVSSCLLYTSPSPRDKRQSRMPSSA